MLKRLAHIALGLLLVTLVACEGVDCPLNNVVLLHITFYNAQGEKVAVTDSLTVTAKNGDTDTTLVNKSLETSTLSLPMSYWNDADTLKLTVQGEDYTLIGDLRLSKANQTHTESPDCPATMFHTLGTMDWESDDYFIDSIKIVKPSVNFDTDENIRIYLHTDD